MSPWFCGIMGLSPPIFSPEARSNFSLRSPAKSDQTPFCTSQSTPPRPPRLKTRHFFETPGPPARPPQRRRRQRRGDFRRPQLATFSAQGAAAAALITRRIWGSGGFTWDFIASKGFPTPSSYFVPPFLTWDFIASKTRTPN